MPPAKPRVILLTGDGKGKTTSALGMVLRAAGHGMRVALIHFIKCDRDTGENRALARFPEVEVHFCGCGFVRNPSPAHLERHRAAAQRGLELARERLQAPEPDMVVLDEICCAVSLGLLDAADVVAAVRIALAGRSCSSRDGRPPRTGRAGDTVSDIACVRHGMDAGWPAQPGVECW